MVLTLSKEIVNSFAQRRILVVGDLMLDRYVHGSVSRISPEAPVPVVQVTREQALPGGAANVALNICSLGGQVIMAGIVGQDHAAGELVALLEANRIETSGLVEDAAFQTTVKTRVLAERQQVVRVDREHAKEIDAAVVDRLCDKVSALVGDVDGVIIEDYGKGVVNQRLIDAILAKAGASGTQVALDPKDNQGLEFTGLALATPNYMEACVVAGLPHRPLLDDPKSDPCVRECARILQQRWNCDLLIITLGPHGMYLAPRGEEPQVIPTKAREVFDVSGAGDTVIATATLALVSGAEKTVAATLANVAAGVVVGKLGTATCSAGELLAGLD